MPSSRSRSASVPSDEELRLPRPPGVFRRFWARHTVLADILIALFCLFFSLAPASSFSRVEPVIPIAPILVPVTAAVASVLMLVRRRVPLVVFAASLAVGVVYLLAPLPVGGPLLFVASYSVAVHRSSRACWAALGAGLAVLSVVAFSLSSAGAISIQIAINAVAGELVLGLIGALIGVNVGNRRRYLAALIDRSRQLLVERDQQGRIAAAAERSRIAREMHDIVSHSLTVVVALADGAAVTDDRERARAAMEAVGQTARGALAEMRAMLGVLRDVEGEVPLVPTAPVSPHDTVVAAQRAGYPVTLTIAGESAALPQVDYAVGRIVQEGITNAMRHAPTATSVTVRIDHADGDVTILVRNDGARPAPRAHAPGFGLRGLSERAALVGGRLSSGPVGDGRWELRATLPAEGSAAALPSLEKGAP